MAKIKYFADIGNQVIELGDKIRFNGGRASDPRNFSGFVDGRWLPATRKVEIKSFPSRHDCDARCLNATGRVMKCECACGGKNHGRGSAFICEAA